jgi:hypothetical protein
MFSAQTEAPRALGVWLRAGLSALLVLGILSALLGSPDDAPRSQDSYAVTASGHRLFHDLLADLDLDVQRWRRMPASLNGNGHTLLLLEPRADAASGQSRFTRDLLAWTARGNTVVIAPRHEEILLTQVKRLVFETAVPSLEAGLCEELATELGWTFASVASAGRSEEHAPPPRSIDLLSPAGARTSLAVCSRSSRTLENLPSAATILAEIGGQPFAARVPHGEGAVVFLASAEPFRNECAARADTPVFLVRLITSLTGGSTLLLDEFFHGHTAADGLLDLALSAHLRLLVLQILLVAGLWIWSRAPRFGPLREPSLPPRRSKEEHVHAMAQLLDRGSSADAAATRLLAALETDLRVRLRLRENASGAALAERLEGRWPELAASLRQLQGALPLRGGSRLRRQDPLVTFARGCQDLRTLATHATRS